MKKSLIVYGLLLVMLLLSGCTQGITKSFGGNMTLHLEPNSKLEEITWKDDSLWYLTRPMTEDDIPETHIFQQKSELGVFEGTVTIIETSAEPEVYEEYLLYKKYGYTINDILNGRVDYSVLYGTEDEQTYAEGEGLTWNIVSQKKESNAFI